MRELEGVAEIEYTDFIKLDIRVAKIVEVEEIEGADKLYKLMVECGEEEPKTICAGIKEYYTKEELNGKTIVMLVNLKPRKLRGIESQGMLLAASNSDHTKVSLLTPDAEMEAGNKVN